MGKRGKSRGCDSIMQKSSRELKSPPYEIAPSPEGKKNEIAPSPESQKKRGGSDSIVQKSMKKSRSSDSILQKSTKKSRELKDLGPTLEELKPGYKPCPAFWMDSDDEEEEEDMSKRRPTYSSEDSTISPEEEAEYRRQSRGHAETALQYYNKKNGKNYELVDALDYVIFLVDGFWLHCNFTAKWQMDAQPQLFFAEMRFPDSLRNRPIVLTCRILKEGKTKTTIDGCRSCGGDLETIIHPINGFRRGQPKYQARTLRSRAARVY